MQPQKETGMFLLKITAHSAQDMKPTKVEAGVFPAQIIRKLVGKISTSTINRATGKQMVVVDGELAEKNLGIRLGEFTQHPCLSWEKAPE